MKDKYYLKLIFLMLVGSMLVGCGSSLVSQDISNSAFNGKLDEVSAFVKAGADVNFIDENENRPIINAAANQHFEVVKFLLSKGAKVDATNSYGETALTQTCEEPTFEENGAAYYKIAKLLIESGANVNTKDGDGVPLLKHCIDNKADNRVIKLLKEKGAH